MIEQEILEDPKSDGDLYIPHWFRYTTAWWASGQISDMTYTYAIQFLLDEKFMIVPLNQESANSVTEDFL